MSRGHHLNRADLVGHGVVQRPELLPGNMSGSVSLQQPGSVLVSVAHVATEGHLEASSLGSTCGLLVCAPTGAMLVWVTWTAARGFVWIRGLTVARI